MFRESDLLAKLAMLSASAPHIIEGVAHQDDGAVVSVPEGRDICATTDFVRGTGFALFQKGHLSLRDIGRYVVAANVSDLAAMGATPHFYLSVIRYQRNRTLEEVEQILAGISDACDDFGCPLVGGDSGSYACDVLSGTAIGTLPRGKRLSRNTARPDDVILVSGEIGGAAAALASEAMLDLPLVAEAFARTIERWRNPAPRVALGQALVELPNRVSCMDVSDGLTASLQQLGKITGLGFTIDAPSLPLGKGVTAIAELIDIDAIHLSCSASVDFELLVTCAPEHVDAVMHAADKAATRLTRIGRCDASGSIQMINEQGKAYSQLPGVPWDHQVEDVSRMFHANG